MKGKHGRKRMASSASWCTCVVLQSSPTSPPLFLSDSLLSSVSVYVLTLNLDSISTSDKMVLCGFLFHLL